ncbi:hypothetical protein SteCoe_38738 [Stentor coeruleus]|uniref:Flavin-containing monooxygenase n=1 Tax=Stentor coeruleus TaxID=5963 RepID=A0A1R2ALC6_9CILI|nr:hypothetical protein SteCoe_38738 [Stentor coeruleus]
MEVCIIGGGISSISAAKVCKDNGLVPFILDKSSAPGGIWKGHEGELGVWPSLRLLTQKHLTSFSDHLWNLDDPDRSSPADLINYLNEYIRKHDLSQYFHHCCQVTHLERSGEDYKVTWIHNGETNEKVFRYVIIATGRFSRIINPFQNPEKFQGQIYHGINYRDSNVFRDKKVVIIGISLTATELAVDAVNIAQSVTQVFRRPYICMKRLAQGVPVDMIMFRSSILNNPSPPLNTLQSNAIFSQTLLKIVGNPGIFHPEWQIDESIIGKEMINIRVADDKYYEAVTERKITQIKGQAVDVYEHGVVLSDGRQVEADVIALGTGFQPDYSFLSDEIKSIIQYDPDDRLTATIMCRSIFHPDLPRLCFVGNFASPAPGHIELQAEIGVKFMLGTLEVSNEEIWNCVREEEYGRTNLQGAMTLYSFKDYLVDNIRMLKLDINLERIENELGLKDPPLVPYLFYMDRPGQMEICRAWAEDLKVKYPMFRKNN